jgi:hypothetical protein
MTSPIIFVGAVTVTYAIAWLAAKWLVATIEARQSPGAPRSGIQLTRDVRFAPESGHGSARS